MPEDEEKNVPATDTPTTPSHWKFPWGKDWWRDPRKAIAVAAAVVILVALGVIGVAAKTPAITQNSPATPAVELVGATNVFDNAQYNGEFVLTTPAHRVNGKDLTDGQLNQVITFGVKDVKVLRMWQLCGAELRAASAAYSGLADAYRKYPHNMPYNEPTPNVAQSVGADNNQAMAAVLVAAATYADDAQIQCIDGAPSLALRWVAFRLYGDLVVVSDYDVTQWLMPLEAQVFLHKCVSRVEADRDREAKNEVDASPAPNHPSFTEVEKASDLSTDDALIALLQEDSRTRC